MVLAPSWVAKIPAAPPMSFFASDLILSLKTGKTSWITFPGSLIVSPDEVINEAASFHGELGFRRAIFAACSKLGYHLGKNLVFLF
jgi:hypothetical protein